MDSKEDEILTEKQVAELLHIAAKTLGNWRRANKGPPYFLAGKRVRYSKKSLDEWMKENER